jgi:inorganic pyrophosphatase/exopolyphosphatase
MAILDVIQYDYKIFELSGKRCGVGTLETTNPAYGLGRKDEVLE